MAAIYSISIFIFIFYFAIGYKRFHTDAYKMNKVGLGCLAILLRVFFYIFGRHELSICLNMATDLITGIFIYLIIKQHDHDTKGIIGASFYLLNPVILIYSCMGEKNLSIWILLLVLCIWEIQNKRFHVACACFSISLYVHVETIFLAPVFCVMMLKDIKQEEMNKRFGILLGGLVLPFAGLLIGEHYIWKGQSHFVGAFNKLINSEYMDYNACNFWGMIGKNWQTIHMSLYMRILMFMILMALLCVGTFYVIHRWDKDRRCYLFAAFLSSYYSFFFGIGINDHLFLLVSLLGLGCFLASGYKKAYGMYVGLSLLNFCNQVYTYSLYNPQAFNNVAPSIILFSFLNLIGLIAITKWLLTDPQFWGKTNSMNANEEISMPFKSDKNTIKNEIQKLEIRDYLVMAVLSCVFIALSLPRLGSHVAPQTTYKMSEDGSREIILDLGEVKEVDHLAIFLGQEHAIKVNISSYDEEARKWQLIGEEQNVQSVFAWNKVVVDAPIRYLGIVTTNREAFFNELAIVGKNGELIEPITVDKYSTLFDEQKLYKAYPTYYDQTFFDEVYHARTAYEYIVGDTSYENTHPPLGKILISLGIRVFGMNPFGWRIVVEIFGIMMIPLMYLFAKKIFKSFEIATMTTLLLTMDFMHFTLAKIATLDIIIGFFILLMYYFMYWYCQIDLMKEPLKKSFLPLGLCGITMGVGIATKWTGVYAGAGLAILFFVHIARFYKKSKEAKKPCIEKMMKTFGFCMIFFVIIPATIYCLSYIPFIGYREYNGLLDKVFDNMKTMFDYHSKLVSTHPYESWWYEWPWIKRPLYQAVTHRPDGMGSAISCFGNPLVWWPGMIGIAYNFKIWLWDKDKKAGFLCISYAAQLVPWMFVTRNTFIYHYFPSSLMMILMIGYCMQKITMYCKNGKKIVWGYSIAVILVFAMFYPVISGMWVNEETARLWLRWLSTWTII